MSENETNYVPTTAAEKAFLAFDREREARLAAERRAEAAETECAEARAFVTELHNLTFCESHRNVVFGEWQENGGPECPLCQHTKIEELKSSVEDRDESIEDLKAECAGLRARLAEIEAKTLPVVNALMELGFEDLGMTLVEICGVDIDVAAKAEGGPDDAQR